MTSKVKKIELETKKTPIFCTVFVVKRINQFVVT